MAFHKSVVLGEVRAVIPSLADNQRGNLTIGRRLQGKKTKFCMNQHLQQLRITRSPEQRKGHGA
jgi:hypothetical protein